MDSGVEFSEPSHRAGLLMLLVKHFTGMKNKNILQSSTKILLKISTLSCETDQFASILNINKLLLIFFFFHLKNNKIKNRKIHSNFLI